MAVIFKGNNPKFPKNESELNGRLIALENLINAENSNIPFVESAFKLMEDCNLITQENINFLMDPIALKCKHRHFRFPFLTNEGVLRQVTNYNDVTDTNGMPRFYKGNDRRVEFGGKMYVISNDWYKDNNSCPNKRPFFNWLADKATAACKNFWNAQVAAAPKKPSAVETLNSSINQLDNKINVLYSNLAAINTKIDELSANISQLNSRVENLSNYMAQTANGINNLDKLPSHMAEFATLKNKVDQLNAQIDSLKKNGVTVSARWN